MSDIGKTALKNKIDAKIYDNESQLITGAILNEVLQDAVDTLADGGNLDAGSVDTANLNDEAVTKGKLEQNVSADLDWAVASNSYYRNSQAGDVAAKVITTYKNMNLIGGGSLKVTFEQANTADDATLNIDGKGAKPLYYNGARVSSTNSWEAGETVEIYYNNYTTGIYYAKRWMVEPVSVSQNSQTGHTDITIGSETTPVASAEEIDQLKQDVSSCVVLEVGALSNVTGEPAPYDIRARMANYFQAPFSITVDDDYLIAGVYIYSMDAYGNLTFKGHKDIEATEYSQPKIKGELYRLTFKKPENLSFVDSELTNIVLEYNGSIACQFDEVESAIYNIKEYSEQNFSIGYYDLSHSVVYPTLNVNQNFRSLKLKVNKGDKLFIKVYGGNDGRAFALADNDLNIYSVSSTQADYSNGLMLYIEKDGWAYITDNIGSYANPKAIHYTNIINFIDEKVISKTDFDIQDFNVGHYYDLSHESVRTTLLDNANLATLHFRVSKGDILYIKLIGGYDGRAYALTDNDLNIYDVADNAADYSRGIEIVAQKDGWIYLTDNVNSFATPVVLYTQSNIAKNAADIKLLEKHIQKMESDLSVSMFSSIGMCGASTTAGAIYVGSTYQGEYPEISWGKIMGRMCGVNVALYAKSGASTRTWQTESVCLPALLADTPKQLYLIQLGINDYADSVPIGTISDIHEDYTENPNSFYGNMGRIISQIQTHSPNCKIIICTPYTPLVSGVFYSQYRQPIIDVAEHFGIAYIDTMDSDFLASEWLTNNANTHGAHPSATGYAGIAKAMRTLIEKCLKDDYFADYLPPINP